MSFNIVSVRVTYPYGYGGPFERNYPADTPITTVRDAAMEHFRLTPAPSTTHYLTAQDERLPDTATVGEAIEKARGAALRLIQETSR